jgi:hypothetical protein
MSRPTIIKTERPSVDETVKLLGIPDQEVKIVRSLIDRWANSPETLSRFGDTPVRDKANRNRRKSKAGKHGPSENGHH